MAGEDFAVRATRAAASAIDGLRGKARKSYLAFEGELRKQGCKVAGHRLLGTDGGHSEYCCKRLVEDWRAITTFEPGLAIVIALGRPDERGFYAEMANTLAIGASGQRRRESPTAAGREAGRASALAPAAPRDGANRDRRLLKVAPLLTGLGVQRLAQLLRGDLAAAGDASCSPPSPTPSSVPPRALRGLFAAPGCVAEWTVLSSGGGLSECNMATYTILIRASVAKHSTLKKPSQSATASNQYQMLLPILRIGGAASAALPGSL